MRDPIAPPAARVPEEALELVAQAFSDGDIEAALAQYEDAAQILPWAWPANASADIHTIMTRLMALRLPLSVQIQTVLQARDLTMVVCERRIAGLGPDCEQVRLTGHGFAAIRPQPDGSWRIAADAWCLEPAIPPDPPEVPPGDRGHAIGSEGSGRAPSIT